MQTFYEMEYLGEAIGVKLESAGGLTTWEAFPLYRHQKAVDRIRATISPIEGAGSGCACIHAADVSIQFPDGSKKRPDIAIFCREPEESDESTTLLPEAVIEIISKGYEAKDIDVGIPYFISQGVKDAIAFDPMTQIVTHVRRDSRREHVSPVAIRLECGCVCVV